MKYQDKEFLITELIENNKSYRKLAHELGVSDFTVKRYAEHFGIKKKKKSSTIPKSLADSQKKYYEKRKAMAHTKQVTNLSDIVLKEFQKIRKEEKLTNEGLMVKLLVMWKEAKI